MGNQPHHHPRAGGFSYFPAQGNLLTSFKQRCASFSESLSLIPMARAELYSLFCREVKAAYSAGCSPVSCLRCASLSGRLVSGTVIVLNNAASLFARASVPALLVGEVGAPSARCMGFDSSKFSTRPLCLVMTMRCASSIFPFKTASAQLT